VRIKHPCVHIDIDIDIDEQHYTNSLRTMQFPQPHGVLYGLGAGCRDGKQGLY